MNDNRNIRTYGQISGFRLLNIDVILDDSNLIYSGRVEDAPENIKELKYSKINMMNPMKVYVYSDL